MGFLDTLANAWEADTILDWYIDSMLIQHIQREIAVIGDQPRRYNPPWKILSRLEFIGKNNHTADNKTLAVEAQGRFCRIQRI